MDDQSKKAVELVQGLAKHLIGLAAVIVAFTVVFSERLQFRGPEWAFPATWLAYGLSILLGVWALLALSGALRAASSAGIATEDEPDHVWILRPSVRFPLFLQAIAFAAGVGLLTRCALDRKPEKRPQTTQASLPGPSEDLLKRLARLEERLAEQPKSPGVPVVAAPAFAGEGADNLCAAIEKLTNEVGGMRQALTEQLTALTKQQRQVAISSLRQHDAEAELVAKRSECERLASILASLRPIMSANLAGSDPAAYQRFWTLYSDSFVLIRTPELIQGVEDCARLVQALENGPVLNTNLQGALKQRVVKLTDQCRNRFRELTPPAEEVGAK